LRLGLFVKIDAILWDYDGTLVNSAPKNINITKDILGEVAPHLSGNNLPRHLNSESSYHRANHAAENWRDLYINFFGLTREEADIAGALWSKHQRRNTTPVALFDRITETIQSFAHIPHGICSQNSTANIRALLDAEMINSYFKSVVGYEDVPFERQKPASDAGVKCLGELFDEVRGRTLIVIGDHESDVIFGRNIAADIDGSNSVVSIAVSYSGADTREWDHQPDKVISSPQELEEYL
jgi:phosphoglycolate phosphatase-like HAD superfamily hydrolase